jgi:hypothetical protein
MRPTEYTMSFCSQRGFWRRSISVADVQLSGTQNVDALITNGKLD